MLCSGEFQLKINKRGGSNKAYSWEFFLKKNKKNSTLIRKFRVSTKAPIVIIWSLNFMGRTK